MSEVAKCKRCGLRISRLVYQGVPWLMEDECDGLRCCCPDAWDFGDGWLRCDRLKGHDIPHRASKELTMAVFGRDANGKKRG